MHNGLIIDAALGPSNRTIGSVFRENVLAIMRKRYADFGPTLAAENERVGPFVRSRTDYDATAPLARSAPII